MNLPNRLTLARFFLTLAFVASLGIGWPYAYTTGLWLFVIGSITDYFDGYLARKHGLETDFGRLMDPLVDKIMISGAFICLIPGGYIPAWAVVVIISREFLITGLRLLALSKGVVLPAESAGKHKTIWQIVTVIFFLLVLSLRELGGLGLSAGLLAEVLTKGGAILIAVTLALTLYSGIGYLWRNRALLLQQ